MATKYIRMDEVRRHTSADSTWFVIHDAVYDVTPFLEQHPGGSDALLESSGRDSTQAFEDVGHSDGAREDMKKFKVGDLHPDDRAKNSKDMNSVFLALGFAAVVTGLVLGFVLKRYVL